MLKCRNCGAQLDSDALFCTECGKELPMGIVCPHCGASYELYDTPENEKRNYPYWDDLA